MNKQLNIEFELMKKEMDGWESNLQGIPTWDKLVWEYLSEVTL